MAAIKRLTTPQAISPMQEHGEYRADTPWLHSFVRQAGLHQALEVKLLAQRLVARGFEVGECDAQLLVGEFGFDGEPLEVGCARAEGAFCARDFRRLGLDRMPRAFRRGFRAR